MELRHVIESKATCEGNILSLLKDIATKNYAVLCFKHTTVYGKFKNIPLCMVLHGKFSLISMERSGRLMTMSPLYPCGKPCSRAIAASNCDVDFITM